MPAPLWLLWLLSDLLISSASCHVIEDLDGALYLETTVVTEAHAMLTPPSYRVTIVVGETRSAFGARVLFSDTLTGTGHLTPAHPMPEVVGDSLFMGALVEPRGGTVDADPSNNEIWVSCTLEEVPERRADDLWRTLGSVGLWGAR